MSVHSRDTRIHDRSMPASHEHAPTAAVDDAAVPDTSLIGDAPSMDATHSIARPFTAVQASSTWSQLSSLHESVLTPFAWKLDVQQKSFIAGAAAGIVSRTATAPMDRIKVALQAGHAHGGVCHESIPSVARKIYASGGWTAFFRGNGANAIKVTPESAIKFWSFSFFSTHFPYHEHGEPLSPVEKLVAGSLSGAISQLAIYPLEIAKTHFCLGGEYKSLWHCISSIASKDGFHGLYRGLVPSLLGIVPYAGVDLALFFTLKELYTTKFDVAPSVGHVLVFGAISSSCGQVVSYPLQVVRTKLQAQGMAGRPVVFTGMTDCFVKILQSYGLRGLYRGIVPNFLKSVPAISISYAVFETVKDAL
ncbi:hypothetical protein H310_02583 [Aphanomyces invadans]|uniref:Mitochondrial carrier protein n=1 Tax=Aphanomyces invadans TaxID=157072 RepID=A0A024UIL9_9STRA|nr:hypothetical protein H310_02583 [Aphanomyces invadans]ETW06291.1 hypothetical protein H310_02583 [Aphanomyces invadans]RHY26525.1 hypothetical protein DYB32_007530 [Aphanomyces invadans]|eukprot:XP_008864366.1 hypothetical protein H310_02583 [Aphanomyces invadans]